LSDQNLDRDDERLASALRVGLAARDRSAPPPRFAAVWPGTSTTRRSALTWRPAFAAVATVVVVAGLSWTWINRSDTRLDASLARELSAPEYWRVPTDELLAFAAPPLSVDLPSPAGFHVSLEESLL